MAIHYDENLDRFRDDSGHFVSDARGMMSSIGRAEFYDFEARQESQKAETFDLEDRGFYDAEHEPLNFETPDDSDLWDYYDDFIQEYDDPDVEETKS